MGASREELSISRDKLIYLLQNLGFLINFPKSALNRMSTLGLLGELVNFQNMTTLSLPTEKVKTEKKYRNSVRRV